MPLAALALLSACTSNEDFAETDGNRQEQLVTFADPFVGKTTRAGEDDATSILPKGDINTQGLKGVTVRVFGHRLGSALNAGDDKGFGQYTGGDANAPFYGEYGTGNDITWTETDGWHANRNYYWPRSTGYYRFTAFAPAEAIKGVKSYSSGSTTNSLVGDKDVASRGVVISHNMDYDVFCGESTSLSNYGITNIPFVQKVEEGYDLLVSNRWLSEPTDGVTDRDPIYFKFQHILSKLSVKVYSRITSGAATIKLKNIKLYLPKVQDGAYAEYKQNQENGSPAAPLLQENGTYSKGDRWNWVGFTNRDYLTSPITGLSDLTGTGSSYDVYTVYDCTTDGDDTEKTNGKEITDKYLDFAAATATDAGLQAIGNTYFVAPTPTFTDATVEVNPVNYTFYLSVSYDIITGNNVTPVTDRLMQLKDALPRLKQGYHHYLYLGLGGIMNYTSEVQVWGCEMNDETISPDYTSAPITPQQ